MPSVWWTIVEVHFRVTNLKVIERRERGVVGLGCHRQVHVVEPPLEALLRLDPEQHLVLDSMPGLVQPHGVAHEPLPDSAQHVS
jgi:hypothetical protein